MTVEELAARLRCHLREERRDITLTSTTGRAYPLGMTGRPSRTAQPESLQTIVDFLGVSSSPRYARTAVTYCNVYAYDYAYLSGVFLPRVWWDRDSVDRIESGKSVQPMYASTVFELNANALYDWFERWGPLFGWARAHDANELQSQANLGEVCIIVARNRSAKLSGHVNAIIPETATLSASRAGGVVDVPVQSQAGATNFERRVWTRWWEGSSFDGHFSYWHHA